MEGSVIHHNHSFFGKFWKQVVLKPILKQFMVHRSGILARSYELISHFSGHDACTRIFASSDPIVNQLPSGAVAMLPIKIAFNSCFVHICYVVRRNIRYFVPIFCYFVVILFLVACGFFFV